MNTARTEKKFQIAKMLDITAAMKCTLSLAIGLGIGYASAKIARIIGYLAGVSLLVAAVASAFDVCPVNLAGLMPRAADPLKEAIAIVADGAINWIGTYATEPENATYLGPAAAGIFIGMALA